jgi:hypothetical protein
MCLKKSSKKAVASDEDTPEVESKPVVRSSDDGGPSDKLKEVLRLAKESRSTGAVRPVARGDRQKRSLIERGMLSIRYPTGRG